MFGKPLLQCVNTNQRDRLFRPRCRENAYASARIGKPRFPPLAF